MDANKIEKELTGYPSIDKPWLKYYSNEAINAPLPECTVYENVYLHNKDYPNHIALEYFGIKINYKKLFEQVDLCANTMVANGITKGSIINICSSAIPEITYLVLACSKVGAVANFINPLFDTQQKIDRINDTDSDTLFLMDKMYSYSKDVIAKTHIKNIIIIPATNSLPITVRTVVNMKETRDRELQQEIKMGKIILWNDYIKSSANKKVAVSVDYQKDMPIIMVYSSGTTGASKAIVLTNDGINATITQYDAGLFSEEKRGNRFLYTIPVWFSTGIVISLLMSLCLGTTCILEPLFNPKTFLEDIIKYKPHYALVTTSLWLYVIEHINKEVESNYRYNLTCMAYQFSIFGFVGQSNYRSPNRSTPIPTSKLLYKILIQIEQPQK